MLYLDTSLLVAAMTEEVATERAQGWLAQQNVSQLTISDWVITEFSAALSVKVRSGRIRGRERTDALREFAKVIAESIAVLSVTGQHFRLAARLADQSALGLRSGDALHLAVTMDSAASICTLDRRLAQAATALGIPLGLN
jgi:predicted nucleic acid-binding protein